ECFIDQHRTTPTHWAHVWDFSRGYFLKSDISCLTAGPDSLPYAIPLGHHGHSCPNARPGQDEVLFLIVDINGIHNTRVHFCTCHGNPVDRRRKQLMAIGLFPATVKRPTLAFSIDFIQLFHRLHLQGKLNAYDFIQTFRRITDNVFAGEISDPYPQFRRVFRVWTIITAKRRSGQMHGIDHVLDHRPNGNMLVYCPACPEKGVNMENNWEATPEALLHLNQRVRTIDGNFHVGKYAKNTDDDDVSLFRGCSYIPEDGAYREYLRNLPKSAEP
ncbi:hypothetical protein FPV67DRAFT_1390176, partial [Lyophyllum atratum]